MKNDITRRAAILSSIAALAGAAVPKAQADAPKWLNNPYSGSQNYGECVEHGPIPTKMIQGLAVSVLDDEGNPHEYGPVYNPKAIEQMQCLVDILI